jgi:predicted phosphodiesterase
MSITTSKEKLALISDVHGNLPALEAIVADAKQRGVERFLLLGDYITDFPFPNEVAEFLRNLDNAVIIRGNKEERFEQLRANPELLQSEQMAAARWNMRELTGENESYLFSLPDTATLEFCGETLFATHSVREFNYSLSRLRQTNSSWYRDEQLRQPFPRSEYISKLTDAIAASPELATELTELPRGIYAYGHNHLQAHFRLGDKLFVNPGSCGLPCDFEATAPYTILTAKDGNIAVEEIRVNYDIAGLITAIKTSAMYSAAQVWCDLIIHSIQIGRDIVNDFVQYAFSLSQISHRENAVVSDEIWREAWATWDYTRGR